MENQLTGIHISQLMNLEIRFCDDENRPLAENKVPFEYKKNVAMQQLVCPYSDSRYMHYKPMNASALKQITKHWPSLINSFDYIRKFYVIKKSTTEITLLDLYKITIAGYVAPSYLIYHSNSLFADGKIPAPIAAIYKASAGLVSAVQLMLVKGIITKIYDKDTVVDPEMVFSFADNEGLFIGAEEVCAGSPNMIKDVLEAIIYGRQDEDASARFEQYISNFNQFSLYATQAGKVLLLDFLFPILFYFSVPITTSANIFKILQATNSYQENSSSVISMELQILERISPLLDSVSNEYRENALKKSLEIFASIDVNSNLTDEIKETYSFIQNEWEHKSDKLIEFLYNSTLEPFQPKEIQLLAQGLMSYLLLERKKLQLYSYLQLEMNHILKRTDAVRSPDSIDINKMYGDKLRNRLEKVLSVYIENNLEETIIRKGSNEIII